MASTLPLQGSRGVQIPHVSTMQKRYQYWSKDGLVWTKWFDWDTDYMPEFQMEDRRIFCRLKNEYRDENKVH